MNTPKAGDTVFIVYLTVEDRSSKPKPVPRAKILEREFYRVIPNYLDKFGERWVVGPKGKASEEKGFAPYGVACKPCDVFATLADAKAELRQKINRFIVKLEALKP